MVPNGNSVKKQAFISSLRCRKAVRSRCKDLEPQLLREHTLALRRRLLKASDEHQQQVADRNMCDPIAAEDKQLVMTGSQKKSQKEKKKVMPAMKG